MMDADAKVKWIAALRSGNYTQTQTVLHNKDADSYCCLGVLCDVMGVERKVSHADNYFSTFVFPDDFMVEERSGSVPYFFQGITASEQSQLISLNDDMGNTFGEIADYIEKNL